jgi:hypothetical protein
MRITALRLVLAVVVGTLATGSIAVAATTHHGHGAPTGHSQSAVTTSGTVTTTVPVDHHAGAPGPIPAGAQFFAHLTGYQETPSINSGGTADVTLSVSSSQITFDLKFSGLSGPPSVAHVHVGQPGVAGAVSFFLCGGGSKPACPTSTAGEVTGTVVASDIMAIPAQGFDAGDLASVEKAIAAGVTYANIHTQKFPGGEIRGQILGGTSGPSGH